MTNMMYRTLDFLDREIVIKITGHIAAWTSNPITWRYFPSDEF